MNIEDRLSRLERSNKYYKIALAICLCVFMVSAKDIFVKDEIHAKKIIANEIQIGDDNHFIKLNGKTRTVENKCKKYWSVEYEAKYDKEDTLKCKH